MSNGLKKIFFTSDWHVGHANIIKYSNRPFKNVDHMAEVLITRFNATVPLKGLTYFVGDMGFGSNGTLKKVIDRLNGTKVLVLGNHDGGMHAMYHSGFDAVVYGLKLYIGDELVTVSHCPLPGIKRENTEGMRNDNENENWHGERRLKHKKYIANNEGQFHLHGHIHSPNGGRSERVLGRQYDVGVDANNYTPVSMSSIESWIAKTKMGK